MKLWIDDVRPAPEGYEWCKSVWEAKNFINIIEDRIMWLEKTKKKYPKGTAYINDKIKESDITIIDIDHDAGHYSCQGGDYIKLLDWLEETGRNYPIRIHSMNPVGRENMRAIIRRNGWTEVM